MSGAAAEHGIRADQLQSVRVAAETQNHIRISDQSPQLLPGEGHRRWIGQEGNLETHPGILQFQQYRHRCRLAVQVRRRVHRQNHRSGDTVRAIVQIGMGQVQDALLQHDIPVREHQFRRRGITSSCC